MPALDPLVLVLQAVKPVLQALALGIDAQNHTTCRRGARAAVIAGSPGAGGWRSRSPFLGSPGFMLQGQLSSLPTTPLRVDSGLTPRPHSWSPQARAPGSLPFLCPVSEQCCQVHSLAACVGGEGWGQKGEERAGAAPLCIATS